MQERKKNNGSKTLFPAAQWLPDSMCNVLVCGKWNNRTAGLQSRVIPQLAAEPDPA